MSTNSTVGREGEDGGSDMGPKKDKTHRRQCKMLSYKKNAWKGTLRKVFICQRPRTPTPPLHTVYACISILIHIGKGDGGRIEPERRSEGQQFTKLGRKYQHD